MLFETKDFYIDIIEYKDLDEIVDVYNSNKQFLINHIGREQVTNEWIAHELDAMKLACFYSCKIVEIKTGKITGIIDFKIGKETYLSLLMLRNSFKGKGYGKSIFHAFEEYAKLQKSKHIRIDVVADYDNSVLDFWFNNGFVKAEDIQLNWAEKVLPAVVMKKYI